MSTLSVTTVTTANGTTDLSLSTGNTSNPSVVLYSGNGNISVGTNNLTLGTSTLAANGYTYLPNGLKMNWGMIAAANTAAGSFATYSSPYTTATYAVTLTHQSTTRTVSPLVITSNTTGANISSGLATTTGTNVYFVAIGF